MAKFNIPKTGHLFHFFVLSLIILSVAFIAGCTSQNNYNSNSAVTGLITAKGSGSDPAISGASPQTETKTGNDKIQATIAAALADGTYANDMTYAYHAGTETVTFSVTVKDDIVTAVSVTPHNPAKMSARIIGQFSDALPGLVVGKRIEEISLPKNVAGSSLTSAAFVQYLNNLLKK